jgi:hypothetical protein
VSDVKIRLFVPDTFLLKEPEKSIALLKPNESKTVTFEIRPTKECGDCEVSGRVTYYDYASRKTRDADIPAKLLSIVCPVLRPWEIEEPEWRSAISRLVKAEETTREIEMPAKILFETVTDIFKDLNLFMLPATVTETPQLYRAIARFAAEGVKGLKYAVQIEVVGGAKKSKLFLKAWAEKEEALTGFYHGILSDIKERVQVENLIDIGNVYVNIDTGGGDYMSGGTKTETGGGDYLEGGAKKVEAGGDYQEGGAIKTAEIGVLRGGISSTKKQESKCPRCGRAISEDEKFCPACGAKVE